MVVISKEMISLLNYRIEQEEASSRLYKAMSVWLDFHGYAGAASLWQKYSNEECVHAGWAYQFLYKRERKTHPSFFTWVGYKRQR